MQPLLDLVAGKTVAVVGNARSIYAKDDGAAIDGHDVVVRINVGVPQWPFAARDSIGVRSTVWASAKFWSIPVGDVCIGLFMKPEGLTPLGDKHWPPFKGWVEGLKSTALRWPMNLEQECREFVGADPGTGIRLVWWLKKKAEPKSVSVYGFDFWQTVSHWSGKKNTPNHSPELEAIAMQKLLA